MGRWPHGITVTHSRSSAGAVAGRRLHQDPALYGTWDNRWGTTVPGRSDSSCRPTPCAPPKTHSNDGQPNLPMNSAQIVTSSQSPSRQGASVPLLQPCQTHILSKWLHGVAGGTAGVMAAPGAGGAAALLEGDANSTESALWEGSAQLFFFFSFFPMGNGNDDERMYVAAASMEKNSGCPVSRLCCRAVCCQHSQLGCAVMLEHNREPKSIHAHSCQLPGKEKKEKVTRL